MPPFSVLFVRVSISCDCRWGAFSWRSGAQSGYGGAVASNFGLLAASALAVHGAVLASQADAMSDASSVASYIVSLGSNG